MNREKYFGLSPRIARWKIDTKFENWLGYKADNSVFFKKLYVLYYKVYDKKYYEGGVTIIKRYIKQRKSEFSSYSEQYIIRDMIYCLHRFGISFQDYCIYNFIDKGINYKNSFVSDKLRYYYCDILNDKLILPLMTDKYACYKKYEKYFKRDILGCYSESDFNEYDYFTNKHNVFIYKPLMEHSGKGIKVYSSSTTNFKLLFRELIADGPFVLEELIIQNEDIAAMHPNSVNSFRVVTFVIKNQVTIIGVTWRIGVGSSIMDNAGAGGIYACVNPHTGVVESDAINYVGQHFEYHPDTNVKIVGYKIPDWDDALELINGLATHIDGSTLISWDIAYSNNGWVMVEANDNGDWSIIQSNLKIGKKNILFSLMDNYFQTKILNN